jgi:hypothetical protein
MDGLDTARMIRWYVPAWLGLTLLTIGASATGAAPPVVAALWIALFVGSVAGIGLLVVSDAPTGTGPGLARLRVEPVEPDRAVGDPACGDLLPLPDEVPPAARVWDRPRVVPDAAAGLPRQLGPKVGREAAGPLEAR